MNKALQQIQEKINDIQVGVLRLGEKEQRLSVAVKAVSTGTQSFDCVIDEDLAGMRNKEVRLVQRYKDDYIYITGKVKASVNKHKTVLSIVILKACWFVRQTEGAVTWLQEKCVYEREQVTQLRMAS